MVTAMLWFVVMQDLAQSQYGAVNDWGVEIPSVCSVTVTFGGAPVTQTSINAQICVGDADWVAGTISFVKLLRFSAKYTDAESGLVMYPYRPYLPPLGRWLSRDPIGERGGKNMYGFVANIPVGLVDSIGLAPAVTSVSDDLDAVLFGGNRILKKNVNVDGTVEGFVTVRTGTATPQSGGIGITFNRKCSSKKIPDASQCHWFQLLVTRFYDSNNNERPITQKIVFTPWYQPSGHLYVDTTPTASPWYPYNAWSDVNALAMFDNPGGTAPGLHRVSEFNSFLVCPINGLKKALFKVYWKKDQAGNYNPVTGNAKGGHVRTIDGIIDWLRELWKLQEVFAADPVTAKLLAA
jgi:RHS repeat-associated protein